jgi:hypothetical protein
VTGGALAGDAAGATGFALPVVAGAATGFGGAGGSPPGVAGEAGAGARTGAAEDAGGAASAFHPTQDAMETKATQSKRLFVTDRSIAPNRRREIDSKFRALPVLFVELRSLV